MAVDGARGSEAIPPPPRPGGARAGGHRRSRSGPGRRRLCSILHEEATEPLAGVELPEQGTVMIVIGPEGGIAPAEIDELVAGGGRPVLISDGVLRTSTAGVVALATLMSR